MSPWRQPETHAIDASYALESDGTISFHVAGRDPQATLVIDPSISVAYASFLGGTGSDAATTIGVDSAGKVYVGGTTSSPTTFAPTATQLGPGIPSGSNSDSNNGSGAPPAEFFVAKIDPTQTGANSLVYLTFLAGSATQAGGLIAVDAAGDVAITGTTTSSDFPVTDGSTLSSGANSTTVSEIDSSGSKLIYSTLFGGNGAQSTEAAGGIALDKNGNIFVASDTNSTNLRVTIGAYAATYQSIFTDGFLAIFQPAATPHLKYCTYLGLNAQVGIGGVAADASGNAYIAGFTSNPLAPFPSKNAFRSTYAGGDFDAFVVKLSPNGAGAADVAYATLLGGSESDRAFAVAVDSSTPPNAYVTGTTSSTNFPVNGTVAAYQSTLPSNASTHTSDAFLSVIGQNVTTGQTSLAYSTYLGGSQVDAGNGLVIVAPYAVYVVGTANSWDFPWRDNFQPFNGYGNAFVAKLDTTTAGSASLLYSTPLGGTSPAGQNSGTQGSAIARDSSGGIWVAGQTTSADFPSAGNPGTGFQPVCASCQQSPSASDAFVAEVRESATQLPSLYCAAPGIPLNFGKQPLGSINIPPQFAAIKNGGEAPLVISTIGIIGPNSSDFSLSNATGCAPATIAPGNMCSFEVGFTPSVIGAEGAFVAVNSNAPGSPQVLAVIGTGVGLAALPTSLKFANQIAGTSSPAQSVTLTNTTSELLYVDSFAVNGANAAAFPPTTTCVGGQSGMIAGANCQFSIVFEPASAGTFAAEIDVQYHVQGVSEQALVIPLSGTGVPAAPVALIVPATINFGSISVATKSGVQTAALTNKGSAALDLTAISITGANADFALATSGDSPCPITSGSLAIGASCTIGVQFAPQSSGTKSAALSFSDNAAASPQSVPLTGTAQSPPTIQITPSSLTFTSQSVATKSAAQQVTITDTGSGPLAINGVSVTGTNATDFSETNNCPASLAAGANCLVNVTFQPIASGSRSASISIADDAANSPQTIALAGTGTQPAIGLSPSSLSFGNQPVATASAPLSITVSNSGSGALVIGKIAFEGTNAGDFSETDNCTGSAAANGIAGGASCAIQIIFTPVCSNASAARTASLTLADNAAASPQSVPLSGNASGSFCFLVPAGASTSASVAPGQTATYALQVEAANGFTGNVTLACAGAPSAATCAITPATLNIGGSMQASVTISVATTASAITGMPPSPNIWVIALVVLGLAVPVAVSTSQAARLACEDVACSNANRRPGTGCAIWWRFAPLALCLCLLACISACGGGGGSSAPPPATDPGTPAGTYAIVITGNPNGGSPQSITLSLTVR